MSQSRIIITLFFIFICSSLTAKDKEKHFIYFQKVNGVSQQKIKLPLKCRMFEVGMKKRVGTIESVTKSGLIFSYFKYDSSDVSKIMDLKIPRKEKDRKLDSLYDVSKVFKQIVPAQIVKIELLSGEATVNRQLAMLFSSFGLLGSGFGLMASTSNHVGQGMKRLD